MTYTAFVLRPEGSPPPLSSDKSMVFLSLDLTDDMFGKDYLTELKKFGSLSMVIKKYKLFIHGSTETFYTPATKIKLNKNFDSAKLMKCAMEHRSELSILYGSGARGS